MGFAKSSTHPTNFTQSMSPPPAAPRQRDAGTERSRATARRAEWRSVFRLFRPQHTRRNTLRYCALRGLLPPTSLRWLSTRMGGTLRDTHHVQELMSKWVPALRSSVKDAAPRPGHVSEIVGRQRSARQGYSQASAVGDLRSSPQATYRHRVCSKPVQPELGCLEQPACRP
jgi:hypothetical protein